METVTRVTAEPPSPEVVLYGVVAGVEHLRVLRLAEHDKTLEENLVEAVNPRPEAGHLATPLARVDVQSVAEQPRVLVSPAEERPRGSSGHQLVDRVPQQPREERELEEETAGPRRAGGRPPVLWHSVLEVNTRQGEAGLSLVKGRKQPLCEVVSEAEQVVHVPVRREAGEPRVLHQEVRGEQPSQHTDGDFEHLHYVTLVKTDVVHDELHGSLELSGVRHDGQQVEAVHQSEAEVPQHVVDVDVLRVFIVWASATAVQWIELVQREGVTHVGVIRVIKHFLRLFQHFKSLSFCEHGILLL